MSHKFGRGTDGWNEHVLRQNTVHIWQYFLFQPTMEVFNRMVLSQSRRWRYFFAVYFPVCLYRRNTFKWLTRFTFSRMHYIQKRHLRKLYPWIFDYILEVRCEQVFPPLGVFPVPWGGLKLCVYVCVLQSWTNNGFYWWHCVFRDNLTGVVFFIYTWDCFLAQCCGAFRCEDVVPRRKVTCITKDIWLCQFMRWYKYLHFRFSTSSWGEKQNTKATAGKGVREKHSVYVQNQRQTAWNRATVFQNVFRTVALGTKRGKERNSVLRGYSSKL